ncbi:MAG: hypothetical protein AB8W37_12125 [Arsenophonus endosymbiont of Dermacentor nuttalli]
MFFMVACVPLLLDTLLSLAGIVSVVNNEASTAPQVTTRLA